MPDGETLITASADRTIRFWSIASGRQVKVLRHMDQVDTLLLSPDGRSLVAGMNHRPVAYIWDLTADTAPVFLNASDAILALAHVGGDRSVVAFSRDGNVRRWDFKERRIEKEFSLKSLLETITLNPEIREVFIAARFLAGGTKLAVVALSSGLHLVDVATEKEIGRFSGTKLVAASPDDSTLAVTMHGPKSTYKRMGDEETVEISTHTSGSIVLLDVDTCREKLRIDVAGSDVWSVAFSPDGKTVAATSGWETGQIHLYEVATGREFRTIETPAIRTPALTFTPDGSKLVCGMADTSVLVWDLHAKP